MSQSLSRLYREFGGEDALVEAVLIYYRDVVLCIAIEFISKNSLFREYENANMGLTTP